MSCTPCSNCFNNCTEIVSDKCVRYTGIDIPELQIQTGDTLSHVEEMITTYLIPLLIGEGDKITLAPGETCTLVSQFLTGLTDQTSKQLFVALSQAACSLQTQVTAINGTLNTLNADYSIGCLTGVTASSDTHDIVQALITRLCLINTQLGALALDVSTNYVQIVDLNSLIQAYLDSINVNNLYKNRMVPYTAVPYYGTTDTYFSNGVGLGNWDRIFLCNGLNGTPDLRGRTLVASTDLQRIGDFDPAVDPANPVNPHYYIGELQGSNTVTLSTTQIPSHTHTNISPAVSTTHTHFTTSPEASSNYNINSTSSIKSGASFGDNLSYRLQGESATPTLGLTNPAKSDVTVTVTIAPTGGGQSHPNIQPSIGCYYIMYIPL